MPLFWEKIPTAIMMEDPSRYPHTCTPIYRLRVPGGWLVRDETEFVGGQGRPIPASGQMFFLPDPDHEWEAEVETPARGSFA